LAQPERKRRPSTVGIDGAHFFGYSLAHYYSSAPPPCARTSTRSSSPPRGRRLRALDASPPTAAPLVSASCSMCSGSLLGGDRLARACRDLCRRTSGRRDQLLFGIQAGAIATRHLLVDRAVRLRCASGVRPSARTRSTRGARSASHRRSRLPLARREPHGRRPRLLDLARGLRPRASVRAHTPSNAPPSAAGAAPGWLDRGIRALGPSCGLPTTSPGAHRRLRAHGLKCSSVRDGAALPPIPTMPRASARPQYDRARERRARGGGGS